MARTVTPEQHRIVVPVAPGISRRRFAACAAFGGAAALLLPVRVLAGSEAQGGLPKEGSGAAPTYTGPLYGHTVTWDEAAWAYSSSAGPDGGYAFDFISLSSPETFALAQVQHGEVNLGDLDEAEESALDVYAAGFGMSRSDAELLDSWASDEAAGTLFYWLGYDDIPYTYIEYSPTDVDGVWSLGYTQIRASAWDADAMTEMLESIWTDGDLSFRATDAEVIVDAIAADVG